jgi:hypothetical protein
MQLKDDNSNFSFQTPLMDDWMSEASLNFWFKIDDWNQLISKKTTLTRSIFGMKSSDGFDQYWEINLRNGVLYVAPFGTRKMSEPFMIFPEFNEANSDELGWWHLSCYYQFYATA